MADSMRDPTANLVPQALAIAPKCRTTYAATAALERDPIPWFLPSERVAGVFGGGSRYRFRTRLQYAILACRGELRFVCQLTTCAKFGWPAGGNCQPLRDLRPQHRHNEGRIKFGSSGKTCQLCKICNLAKLAACVH